MALKHFSPDEMNRALEAVIPSIWRFAVTLTRNSVDADDLTQATCLRALEKREQFQKGGQFRAWCVTICRSIWLNQMRAARVRQTQDIDGVTDDALAALLPDTVSNIFAAEVFKEIMKLPAAQREAVVLVYAEGYRYSEAAKILDVPIGTIMSRLAAARDKLKWMRSDDADQVKEG